MLRVVWPAVIGIAGVAVVVGTVAAQPGAAQPHEELPTELRELRVLPTLLAERIRIADQAVKFLPHGTSIGKLHEFHAQFIAPPFKAQTPRFLPFPPSHPRPRLACAVDATYSHGAFPAMIHASLADADGSGCEGTYLPDGPVTASTHPFFQPLGTNGRSCATCHQPPSGMSVSRDNIVARLVATSGTDPIFAGVDGANCPNSLPPYTGSGTAFRAAHSLLVQRGLFRVFESLPATAEFTITAAHDPNGCNTVAPWNEDTVNGQKVAMWSVYRRPRISASLAFITTATAPGSAGIMWDTREQALDQQALDATHGHAQGTVTPTPAQAAAMVQFETRIYSAQSRDRVALALNAAGAKGGPVNLASFTPSTAPAATPQISFTEYNAWLGASGGALAARRASIARGQKLFNTKQFIISNVAGLNDLPGLPRPLPGTCSGCHSQVHGGNNQFGAAGALDIGIGGGSVAHNGPAPSPDLPIFTITCTGGKSTPFNGSTVVANDPGVALHTGNCADIGKFTIPQLRGLASRAPYFHDGSAENLWAVVDFYNKRFNIGLTYAQKQDLTNFLAAL